MKKAKNKKGICPKCRSLGVYTTIIKTFDKLLEVEKSFRGDNFDGVHYTGEGIESSELYNCFGGKCTNTYFRWSSKRKRNYIVKV